MACVLDLVSVIHAADRRKCLEKKKEEEEEELGLLMTQLRDNNDVITSKWSLFFGNQPT